ncbi:MAG: cbb3-type cytochrome c oxidase subunit II [Opitutales bacterium]
MKNGFLLFAGVLVLLVLSWSGVALSAHRQFGELNQFKDPVDETLYPVPFTGAANQGRMVYQDLGCVSCHTQQVRREGFGADLARQWGTRQSVARDYIGDRTVFLGSARLGPDLRNVGARPTAGAEYFYTLLYAPQSVAPGTNMPAYRFLFQVRPAIPGQPSPKALHLTGAAAAPAGYEIVPGPRAEQLVAYLLNLKDTYEYPEAKPYAAPAAKKEGH